jgi:maltose O-acetyltransferase
VRRRIASLELTIALRLPRSSTRTGKFALRLRRHAARQLLAECGVDVNIEHGVRCSRIGDVKIGDHSGIGINCRLGGPVTIGSDVMMGPDVVILASAHRRDRTDIPMRLQQHEPMREVVIGDDVWIGTRAILLPGVTIGSHAIVGAGAVVTRDVPEWGIAVGNPARVIKDRRAVGHIAKIV